MATLHYEVLYYREYEICFNLYKHKEYSVFAEGEDYIFSTVEDAKAFIDCLIEEDAYDTV